jgi:hypothetical protein
MSSKTVVESWNRKWTTDAAELTILSLIPK